MSAVRVLSLSLLVALASPTAAEEVTNVALGKPVTLSGEFFTLGWCCGLIADPASVVDGALYPRSHQWDQGPVWWNEYDPAQPRGIKIDLGDTYVIESLVAQVDDNDTYEIRYWDAATGTWALAWTVPNYDVVVTPSGWWEDAWGMQTRPNPWDDGQRYTLPAPIETSALLVRGVPPSDSLYAVSEIQAFGYPAVVPVVIDVKPGSDPNSINLGSEGNVTVAVFGSAALDAATIDTDTVTFANAPIAARRNGTLMYELTDLNGDGFVDAVLHASTQDLVLSPDATLAVLEGRAAGRRFRGQDAVRVVP